MRYSSYSTRFIKRKQNSFWQARLKYKDPITGKWKETSKVLPEAKGKREANKMALDWFNEMNEAASLAPAGSEEDEKTISEVVKAYLDFQLSTGKLEQSTYDMQLGNFERNIEPYLGDISFYHLDRTSIIKWHTDLSRKGHSQRYIYTNYIIIAKVYNYYVETGELAKNPFNQVKITKEYAPKITHLTTKQMENFLTNVYANFDNDSRMLVGCLLAYYAALRRGEICGLRWRDIDFTNHTLTVSSAIGITKDGTYTKNPKNKSSVRTFPMIPQLEKALKERYDEVRPEGNWFVIGNKTEYMSPLTFSTYFKDFVDAYNITDAYGNKLTPHGLRHNMASVGVRSQMDIASLSKMMGHASRAMTLDTYADANKDAMIVAADKLSQTFKKEGDFLETDEYDRDDKSDQEN